jgi:hypothetical protein
MSAVHPRGVWVWVEGIDRPVAAFLGAAAIGVSLSVLPVGAGRSTSLETDEDVSQFGRSCDMVVADVSRRAT